MAAGDIFSNMSIPITGTVDVQPAAGVQVMISFIGGSATGAQFLHFGGKNAVGNTGTYDTGYGAGNTTELRTIQTSFNMKMFITNSQYFILIADAGTHNMSYSGIEI